MTLQTFSEISGLLIVCSDNYNHRTDMWSKFCLTSTNLMKSSQIWTKMWIVHFMKSLQRLIFWLTKWTCRLNDLRIVKRSMYRANAAYDVSAEDQSVEDYYKVNMYIPAWRIALSYSRSFWSYTRESLVTWTHRAGVPWKRFRRYWACVWNLWIIHNVTWRSSGWVWHLEASIERRRHSERS